MTAAFEERLETMRGLGPDWDSYGAGPISPEAIRVARQFLRPFIDAFRLPEPFVAPTRVGGVLASWVIGPHEMEVEFEVRGSVAALAYVYENVENGESLSGKFEFTSGTAPRPVALSAIAAALNGVSPHPLPVTI